MPNPSTSSAPDLDLLWQLVCTLPQVCIADGHRICRILLRQLLPRYVKAFTSSSSLPCSVTGFSFAVLILRILVLPSWILDQIHHTNADAVPRENEFGNQGQQPFSARQRLTDLIQTLQVWFGGNSTGWSCHVFTSQCINFFFRLME